MDRDTPTGAAVEIEDRDGAEVVAGVPGGQPGLRRDPARPGHRDRHRSAGDPVRRAGGPTVTVCRSGATAVTQPPARPSRSRASGAGRDPPARRAAAARRPGRRCRASATGERRDRVGPVERLRAASQVGEHRVQGGPTARPRCRRTSPPSAPAGSRPPGCRRGTSRRPASPPAGRRPRDGGQGGGQQMRYVADRGHRPVVLLGRGRHDARAQAGARGRPASASRRAAVPSGSRHSTQAQPWNRCGVRRRRSRRSPGRPSGARRRSRPAGVATAQPLVDEIRTGPLTEVTSVTRPVKPAPASSSRTPGTAGSGTAMTTRSAPARRRRGSFGGRPATGPSAGTRAAAVRAVARVAGSAS